MECIIRPEEGFGFGVSDSIQEGDGAATGRSSDKLLRSLLGEAVDAILERGSAFC